MSGCITRVRGWKVCPLYRSTRGTSDGAGEDDTHTEAPLPYKKHRQRAASEADPLKDEEVKWYHV